MHDGEGVDDRERSKAEDGRRVAELEAQLAAANKVIARLRERYQAALEKLALAERRILLGKAERRVDSDAQLSFEGAFAELKALEAELAGVGGTGLVPPPPPDGSEPPPPKTDGRTTPKTKPKGRRNLADASLPEVLVEILDEEREKRGERIGFEEMLRLAFEKGGYVRARLRFAQYKDSMVSRDAEGHLVDPTLCPGPTPTPPRVEVVLCEIAAHDDKGRCGRCPTVHAEASAPIKSFRIVGAARPKEILPRGMLAPTAIAHLLTQKYCMGVPFHRLEQKMAFDAFPLDRSTMCRYAEHIGACLGAIVEAMRKDALANAFCLSTDATGAAIQPQPLPDGSKQPCRKGHFFVTLADRDHVFFDFQPKHNSLAVWTMFKGFCGYIQADAHVIYNALYRGTPPEGAEETEEEANKRGPPPKEVGCYSHCRRKFWEAAVCRHPEGVEGLRRINDIFAADAKLADLPPAQRKVRRDAEVRPLVEDFFAWARLEKAKINSRGLVATALGYALNHEDAFKRFLEDGRLRLENNRAENALRAIATGRNAWLFFGSDDHATAAANIFSLVASCKLHRIEIETYLAEVIRVLPYWPPGRVLELAPKYWAATRARLSPEELARPLGHVTVPPPAAEQQSAAG